MRGRLGVRWVDGVLIEADGRFLVDPGPGTDVGPVDAVVLTRSTPSSIAGLVAVLSRTEGPLSVWTPLWDDRPSAFVEAWTRIFPREITMETLGDRSPLLGGTATLRAVEIDGAPAGVLIFDHIEGRVVVTPTADEVKAALAIHRVPSWDRAWREDVWAIGPEGAWLSGLPG